MNIKKITLQDGMAIAIKRRPLGLFFLKEKDYYVGVNNSTGHPKMQKFKTVRQVKKWLRGKERSVEGCND